MIEGPGLESGEDDKERDFFLILIFFSRGEFALLNQVAYDFIYLVIDHTILYIQQPMLQYLLGAGRGKWELDNLAPKYTTRPAPREKAIQ